MSLPPVYPAHLFPDKEEDLEEQTIATDSQISSASSLDANPDGSSLKTSLDCYQQRSLQDNHRDLFSDGYCEVFPKSGTWGNGWSSPQPVLDYPTIENDCLSLPTPTALSSLNSRPPGQNKLEVRLKELGLIQRGEVANPEFLEAMFGLPMGYTSIVESKKEMDISAVVEKHLEIQSVCQLQQPHYDECFTLTPSSDNTQEEFSGACGASHRAVTADFTIKSISLWQPWASLISLRLKHYETRSWKTNYRGKLLICSTAANSKQHQEYLKICDELQLPPWTDFPHGCAIAICNLVDCIEMTAKFIEQQPRTEILCGDWQVGRYAWKLENIEPLPPFEVKGKQGLFNLIFTDTQLELVKPQALDSVAKACDRSNEVLEEEVSGVECDRLSAAVGNLDERKPLLQECETMESPISSDLNTESVLDESQVDSDCAEAIANPSIESFLCPSCEQPLLNLEEGCGVCGWVNSLPEPKEKNELSETGDCERCYLPLAEIRRDGGTQPRVAIDLKHIKLLEAQIEDGQELEAVTVFYDGEFYWLADGFHRCAAYQNQDEEDIACIIHTGSVRDAILYSVGTNADHRPALPRSNQDKRRAVRILLEDDEWTKWSDREIAQRCRVGNKFVGDVRRSLCPEHSEKKRIYKTKHGTLAKMETGNIGKKKPASVPEAQGNDTLDLGPDATPQTVDININEIIVAFVSNFKGLNKDQIEGIGNALKLQSPEQAQMLVQAIVSEPGAPSDIVTT